MRKEVWFGLSIMALVVVTVFVLMPPPSQMSNGHLGLLMLRADRRRDHAAASPPRSRSWEMGVMFAWPCPMPTRILELATQQTLDLIGAACLLGDVERRADLDPAVRAVGTWSSAPT